MMSRWKYCEFEKLFSLVIGGDWGKDLGESDPELVQVYCIRGSELREWRKEKGRTAALRKVSQSSLEKRMLKEGDILVEISGGGPDQPVGRTVLIDKDALSFQPQIPKVCTNFFRLVRLIDDVDKRFVNYYLNHFYSSGQIVNYQGGSNNLRNLRFPEYSKIQIPLPPLREQKLIVAKLDTLFAHLDQLRLRLDKIPILLKQFRQAVLTQAVTGKLTEEWRGKRKIVAEGSIQGIQRFRKAVAPTSTILNDEAIDSSDFCRSWIDLRLGNLIMKGDLFDGPFGSHLKTIDYTPVGVRVIRLENIGFLEFIEDKRSYISQEKYDTLLKHTVKEGDVIVSSFISESVRATILPRLDSKAITKADCFCVRPIPQLLNPRFLAYVLSSEQIKETLSRDVHGSTRPRINTKQLKHLYIPVPPLLEQEEIVARIESLYTFAQQIDTRHKAVLKVMEHLPQAILSKSFRGELVKDKIEKGRKTHVQNPEDLLIADDLERGT